MHTSTPLRLLLSALLFGAAVSAHAVSIRFDLGSPSGSVPGFDASFIHAAGGCRSGSYYMCGDKFRVAGEMTLTGAGLDADDNITHATGVAGFVSGTGSAGSDLPDGDWRLDFTTVDFAPAGQLDGSDDVLFTLGYDLFSVDSDTETLKNSGTFYFADRNFTGSAGDHPNSLSLTNLILWGNNWQNGVDYKPSSYALGIDLYGAPGSVIPLPAAAWLFGSALLGLLGWHRRLRRQPAAA